MEALISANVNGGGALGSNSVAISLSSSSKNGIVTGALTFNAQFLSLHILENEDEIVIDLVVLNRVTPMESDLVLEKKELDTPVRGLGKNVGIGLTPHSDKTQAAIGDTQMIKIEMYSLSLSRERRGECVCLKSIVMKVFLMIIGG